MLSLPHQPLVTVTAATTKAAEEGYTSRFPLRFRFHLSSRRRKVSVTMRERQRCARAGASEVDITKRGVIKEEGSTV